MNILRFILCDIIVSLKFFHVLHIGKKVLKSSVNQQRLLADKKLEGTCSSVYFKHFKSFMSTHIGKKAPD